KLALLVLQERHRERYFAVPVDDAADDVRAFVAEEERAQHLYLKVGLRLRRPREVIAQRMHDVAQVAPRVFPAVREIEARRDIAQRLLQPVDQRVEAGVRGRLA